MKLRQFVLVLLLVGGFWFVTTHFQKGLNPLTLTSSRASGSPLELSEAHAAPEFDAEEQNNISVYKRVLPSVVNITSRAVIFNFFYGTVPQEGQGSGFILDKAGHVLTNYHVVEGANRGVEVQAQQQAKLLRRLLSGATGCTIWRCCRFDAPDLQPVVLADSQPDSRRRKGLCHRQSLRPERNHDARDHQFHPVYSKWRRRAD